MNFLGIDTTGKDEIIVVSTDNKKYVYQFNGTKHSEGLLTHVQKVLKKAHLGISDIDVFGNVSGPGSFTGIRIGLATIKAFAYALNKPVVNVSRFEIIASAYTGFALLSCTKNSVYWAKICDDDITYGVCDTDSIGNVVPIDSQILLLEDEHVDLSSSYKNIVTIASYKDLMLPLMLSKAKAGDTQTSNEISPLYIQVSQAERLKGDVK